MGISGDAHLLQRASVRAMVQAGQLTAAHRAKSAK
jgi:hypothetical protein